MQADKQIFRSLFSNMIPLRNADISRNSQEKFVLIYASHLSFDKTMIGFEVLKFFLIGKFTQISNRQS